MFIIPHSQKVKKIKISITHRWVGKIWYVTTTEYYLATKRKKVTSCSVTSVMSTVCDPMDCSLPGSSVHGILQARILEWAAIALLQGIIPTQGQNWVCLLHWQEGSLPLVPPGKPFRYRHLKTKIRKYSYKVNILCQYLLYLQTV